ncbi:MAG: NB-ARC domain-containing protein, partial [Lacipirellulaceae bacterium]
AWLGDDLESVKVLAGEGGKGKTSIAYEFAALIAGSGNSEFDQVIWLTAKRKQFKARLNDYLENPSLNFSDYHSFLKTLCNAVGGMAEGEMEDAPPEYLKRQAREALNIIPTLLIVDDVDSTVPEDQKRILETVRAISNSGSKVLVTTRANITYSQDISISVPGLFGEEYSELVDQLAQRLEMKQFSAKDKGKLQLSSEGSPLYTESIFRLCKLGYGLGQALSDWKGGQGEAVRDAALRREIEALTIESRKVIFLLTIVGSCSISEIRDFLDLERTQVDDCLSELGSLFLVQEAPILENEPRYEVGRSISSLIQSHGEAFLPNQSRFEREIRERANAFELNRKGTKREEVAKAISQCNSLVREKNFDDADRTIKSILRRSKYARNPDLLLMLGKVSYFNPSAIPADAKRKFFDAFHAGQRKELLFDLWYETEKLDNSVAGAMEVCDYAIRDGKYTTTLWYRRAAESRLELSSTVSGFNRFVTLLVEAHENISRALRFSPVNYREELKDMSKEIVDSLWRRSEAHHEYEIAFRTLDNAVQAGDIRSSNFTRMGQALGNLRRQGENDLKVLEAIMKRRLDDLHEQGRSDLVGEIEDILSGIAQ